MASDYLKRELVSHSRRVCSLYREMCRNVDFTVTDFFEARFEKLKIRAEFDRNKNIRDMREAKALLVASEEKFKYDQCEHMRQKIPLHPYSKEGIAYGRNLLSPDWVMDNYHPLEKAQYPYYFAKREQMKKEYIEMWTKKMIKPGVEDAGPGGGH